MRYLWPCPQRPSGPPITRQAPGDPRRRHGGIPGARIRAGQRRHDRRGGRRREADGLLALRRQGTALPRRHRCRPRRAGERRRVASARRGTASRRSPRPSARSSTSCWPRASQPCTGSPSPSCPTIPNCSGCGATTPTAQRRHRRRRLPARMRPDRCSRRARSRTGRPSALVPGRQRGSGGHAAGHAAVAGRRSANASRSRSRTSSRAPTAPDRPAVGPRLRYLARNLVC